MSPGPYGYRLPHDPCGVFQQQLYTYHYKCTIYSDICMLLPHTAQRAFSFFRCRRELHTEPRIFSPGSSRPKQGRNPTRCALCSSVQAQCGGSEDLPIYPLSLKHYWVSRTEVRNRIVTSHDAILRTILFFQRLGSVGSRINVLTSSIPPPLHIALDPYNHLTIPLQCSPYQPFTDVLGSHTISSLQ